jgi:hypothetical protein
VAVEISVAKIDLLVSKAHGDQTDEIQDCSTNPGWRDRRSKPKNKFASQENEIKGTAGARS